MKYYIVRHIRAGFFLAPGEGLTQDISKAYLYTARELQEGRFFIRKFSDIIRVREVTCLPQ